MILDVPELADGREKHVVFYGASWEFYEALLREYDEQPTRVNFSQGTLEIMTLSIEHEAYKQAIGEMVGLISLEFDIPMARRGSTTLKLRAKDRGLESDQCYWVQHEAAVRGLKRLDLSIHPPPDLVVEVDVTHAVVDREAIYASLHIPEMWHFDTRTWLTAWELKDGNWGRIERSLSFPQIRVADLNPFLQRLATDGDTRVLREFRDWLRALPR